MRGLDFWAAASVVVGVVIGSGIFIGPNRVAGGVGSPWLLFAIWIGGGLVTMLGAFVYAEFAAALPRSGGDYVYAREALSPFWGFLNGWVGLVAIFPASVSALAVAFAAQLESLKPADHGFLFAEGFGIRLAAATAVVVFTVVQYLGVRLGGAAQKILTGLKVVLVMVVVGVAFAWAMGGNSPATSPARNLADVGSLGLAGALIGTLWAYDGWTGVTRVSAEVKDPRRNLPRALVLGLGAVIVVYVLVNAAYLAVLGLEGLASGGNAETNRLVAARAVSTVFGQAGHNFVSVVIIVSVLGALNGIMMGGPRLYYAMAKDGLLFPSLARVHPVNRTPHVAILFQGALSVGLALFFSFEQLTGYVVLGSWFTYFVTSIALLRFRRISAVGGASTFRSPGHPWTSLGFAAVSGGLVVYLVVASLGSGESRFFLALNLVAIFVSLPAFAFFRRRSNRLALAS